MGKLTELKLKALVRAGKPVAGGWRGHDLHAIEGWNGGLGVAVPAWRQAA